jgi:hypothetical protein
MSNTPIITEQKNRIYTYTRKQMIDEEEVLHLFIKSILQHIESIENTDVDIATIEELKLLLSDNLAEDGMVHVRKSLMNKTFHLSFANYKNFLDKYEKGHMQN